PAFRGFTPTTGSGIAVLIDGVPINDQLNAAGFNWRPFVLDTLTKIEVIRGPGSAVYGSDAFHGVVSLESFSPDHDVYEGGGELGTDLYYNAFGRMSQGIGESLRLNLAVGYRVVRDQDQDFEFTDAMGTLQHAERANGWSAFTGTAELEYRKHRFDAELAFTSLLSDVNEGVGIGNSLVGTAPLGENDVSEARGALYLGRARAGYALPRDVRAELSGYFWWGDDTTRTTSPPSPLFPLAIEPHIDTTQYRTGARLTFQQRPQDRPFEWTAGYEFTRRALVDAVNRVYHLDSGVLLATLPDPVAGSSRDIHSLLASVQGKLFGDHLKLSAGGRINHYSDFGVQATPRAGIIVLPKEWYALKLLYGRAFRAPSGRETEGGTSFIGPSDLDPEIIDTMELVFQV
ncbi:MAG: TonB-dependent receptor, partial [Polyangiaceae bacterium]|nr:TonB-dependent receptor [Polyangiaceae bacterium]